MEYTVAWRRVGTARRKEDRAAAQWSGMVKWGTHCHAILQHFYPPHIAYQDAFKILLEEMGMWMRNIHDVRDND